MTGLGALRVSRARERFASPAVWVSPAARGRSASLAARACGGFAPRSDRRARPRRAARPIAYRGLVPSPDSQRLRLGGMALRNGLLIHGPTHWAAAVRDREGKIEAAAERKPELAPGLVAKAPGLRGPLKLAEAIAVLPLARRRLPAARLPFEDRRVVVAVAATLAATSLLRRRTSATALREGLVQAIGAVPAVVALLDRDLAAYHGVEHKVIAAYERGVEDAASVPKEHDRCGSNLIVPMMLLSAGGTIVLERLVERPSATARAATGLAGASIAVEMFAWSDRHHGDPLAEAFHTPGREIQRHLATREPTPEQLEVGRAAMAAILEAEAGSR